MKQFRFISLLAVVILTTNQLQAQLKSYNTWVSIGLGRSAVFTPTPVYMKQMHADWHHLFNKFHDIHISYVLNWHPDFYFAPNRMFFSYNTSLQYGQQTALGKHVFFTPAIGLGYGRGIYTGYRSRDAYLTDLFTVSIFQINDAIKPYETYKLRHWYVPASLTFMITGRRVGIETGAELQFGKHPAMNVRFCLSWGKIYARR